MKKLILYLCLFFFSFSAFAELNLGIKGGTTASIANIREIKVDAEFWNKYQSSYQTGYLFGGFLRKNTHHVYYQLEALFLSRKTEASFLSQRGEIISNIYSFEVPLLIGYKLINTSSFSLHLSTGLAFDYIYSSSSKFVGFEDLGVITETTKEKIKQQDYLFLLGAGLDIWRLSLDCRYQMGIRDISEGFLYTNKEMSLERKNKGLNISLGYKF